MIHSKLTETFLLVSVLPKETGYHCYGFTDGSELLYDTVSGY